VWKNNLFFSICSAVVTGSEGWVVENAVLRVSKGIRSSSYATISCKGLKIRWACKIQARQGSANAGNCPLDPKCSGDASDKAP